MFTGLSVLATILRFPNTFTNKTVVFVMDNRHFVNIYNSGRPKHVYLCHLIRNIKFATSRLNTKVVLHWSKRCGTEYCAVADQLTHQNFQNVPRGVKYRKVEQLPAPILNTLLTSLQFKTHTFSHLWSRIVKYWKL